MTQLNSVDLVQQHPQRIKIPCVSFFKRYFNTNSLIIAIFFSLPIYLSIFGENLIIKILNSIISIIAFYLFFNQKHSFFQTGFFIGIFWFYWIGLSFRYYNLSYLIPFIILFIGIGYGIIFWILNKIFSLFKFSIFHLPFSILLWGLFFIFGFDYLKPFTFDWLKPEVLISNSLFLPYKITLFLLILAIILKNKFSFILILIPLFFSKPHIDKPNLKINLITTYIPQDKKWDKNFIPQEIKNNFKHIQNSINREYDVVVLPESAFPIFLNRYPNLIKKLKELSTKITIITGALHLKNNQFYNSTYIFEDKKMIILDKHILVPFGEYIPFPFFQKEINKIFFNGASDYKTSKNFGEFKIKNYTFLNAICYEATIEKLYQKKPKYVIAMSNMAWFMPSIAPILQKLLINIYALKYKKRVYHSLNYYKSYKIPRK
ncbi:apolipoprotein N-acyltransferase [Caminibacter mediatlanticus TB-2]|uniref:Apolipoprotein N-acyltransferase n=1 Tax=Caminibacter mediatlanticus TB-2 TaxID=391592 RepID=A0ABX5VB07_9BACT|nr:apolipoprotein N-acyltransferase [Caminibacter mediatlanticus TB-2]